MNSTMNDSLVNSTVKTVVHEINITYAIFIGLLIFVTALMNLGTVVAFWRVPKLRESPSELLILNLACSDLLTGMVPLPLISPSYITTNHWPTREIGCVILVLFLDISVHGTLFALLTISIDRFLLVYLEYPQYIKRVSRRNVYKVIATGWLFALATAALELGMWEKAKTLDETAASIDHSKVCLSPPRRVQSFSLSFFLVLYLFPVILVCAFSIAFLYHLRLRLKKTKRARVPPSSSQVDSSSGDVNRSNNTTSSLSLSQIGTSVEDTDISQKTSKSNVTATAQQKPTRQKWSDKSVRNRYIKPGITLIGLVLSMAMCMLPYSLYVITIESGCQHCNDIDVLYGLLLLQFCNAGIDPFIYVLTRKKIRMFYRSCLKCNF